MSEPGGDQKTIVITGGNSGIGFETAKVFAKRGWHVVITGRDDHKLARAAEVIGHDSAGTVAVAFGDFASFASVRRLSDELNKLRRIDVLLNNAGTALSSHKVSEDGNDLLLQVNYLSHFLLTHLLLEKIKASKPARIVNVSSRFHRFVRRDQFDDFQFERFFLPANSYSVTKLYMIWFTRELARRLEGSGVTVNSLHPGEIKTDIGDFDGIVGYLWPLVQMFFQPQEAGAYVTTYVASSPALDGVSGKYIYKDLKVIEPSQLAQDDASAARLWDLSCDVTGVGG